MHRQNDKPITRYFQFELRNSERLIQKAVIKDMLVADEMNAPVQQPDIDNNKALYERFVMWVVDTVEKEIDINFFDELITFGAFNGQNKSMEETFTFVSLGLDGRSFGPIDDKWMTWFLSKTRQYVTIVEEETCDG